LSKVVEQVVLLYRFYHSEYAPLTRFAINKRIYVLAKRQYSRFLIPAPGKQSAAFAHLLRAILEPPSAVVALRELVFRPHAASLPLEAQVVARLPNLSSLFLEITVNTVGCWEATLQTIEGLSSLRSLVICIKETVALESVAMDLKKDLPSLRNLEFRDISKGSGVAPYFLRGDNSNITVLRLAAYSVAVWGCLPWRSLRVLQLYNYHGLLPRAVGLPSSLQLALNENPVRPCLPSSGFTRRFFPFLQGDPAAIPLHRLELAPPPTYADGDDVPLHVQFKSADLKAFAELLNRTCLRELVLVAPVLFSTPLPSVQHLTIRWRIKLNDVRPVPPC
jgi:hypothetical protein